MSFVGITDSFMDGFDDRIAADITRRNWDSTVFPQLGTANNRLGYGTYFNGSLLIKDFSDPPYTTISFGLSLITAANFNGAIPIVQLVNSTHTTKLSFNISVDGRVGFYIEGDAAGYRAISEPRFALHNNTWYFIAVSMVMSPVDDDEWTIALEVFVDGERVINSASIIINTLADLSIYRAELHAGGDVNTSHAVTDFFIRAGLAIPFDADILENQRWKAAQIRTLRPINEGTYTEFPTVEPSSPTTHYTKVDEQLENLLDYTQATDGTSTPPVADTFLHSQIPTVLSSSSKETLAAQFTFKGNIENTVNDDGDAVWPIHLVDDIEDETDFGSGVQSTYVELYPEGADPVTIAQANAFDSGVRLKLIVT